MSQWVIDALYLIGGVAAIAVALPIIYGLLIILLTLAICIIAGVCIALIYLWELVISWKKKPYVPIHKDEVEEAIRKMNRESKH